MQNENGHALNGEAQNGAEHEKGQKALPNKVNLRPGMTIVGKYEVLELLGEGGMGAVYRCLDVTSSMEVAIKTIPPELCHSKAEMEDLKENYQMVSKLIHENIAVYRELIYEPSIEAYFIVMELVEGIELREWMCMKRRADKLTLKATVGVLRQVAEALDYAHGMKVMHRDIKPANIMVMPDGRVKVLDFGLAANIHSSMSYISGEFDEQSGTCLYMAPEQWEGLHQDSATDQYALAVIAYEMLAGERPFESEDIKNLFEMVLKEEPKPIAGMPQYVNDALLRGLAKERKERFASCVEFVNALAGKELMPAGTGSASKMLRRGLLLMLVFAVLALGFWRFSRRHQGIASMSVSLDSHIREKQKPEDADSRHKTIQDTKDYSDMQQPGVEKDASGKGIDETPTVPAQEGAGAAAKSSSSKTNADEASIVIADEKTYLVVDLKTGKWEYSKEPPDVKGSRCRVTELWLRRIPHGTFDMGDKNLKRRVILTQDYYIGVFEVTQAQWELVTGTGPFTAFKGEALPVERVSYNDIMERFFASLNIKTGLSFGLPTEAQWEFACRTGKEGRSLSLDEVAWYSRNAENRPHEVGTKEPNSWGLYDICGNVSEKCSDWFVRVLEEGVHENPTGPKKGRDDMRVVRGMSFTDSDNGNADVLKRVGCKPEEAGENAGFRLVLLP